MNAPVAILVIPSVAIGGALMFGGDASPWARYFEPLFGARSVPGTPIAPVVPAVSEGMTSVLVLIAVAIGIAAAVQRYATAAATSDAVARLDGEAARMSALLANLYYFDAAIDAIFVRPSQALGRFFGRLLDPHVLDGAIRELVYVTRWAGTFVRSLQTGLLRAYALILVFGAACFIAYYAIGGAVR